MKKVTIVGGGGTALALACYLKLKGVALRLYDMAEYGQALRDVLELGTIKMIGYGPQGEIEAPPIFFDPTQAFQDADVILISMVANRHAEICHVIAPYLKDGQVVLFVSGNCGSLKLKRELGGKDVVVGETLGNFGPCRLAGKGIVNIAFDPNGRVKPIAAFPATDNARLLAAVNNPYYGCSIYPDVPFKNVLELALNAPNVMIHLASSVLCISAMEHSFDFRLYRDGASPSVVKLIQSVEAEREAIFKVLGYTAKVVSPEVVACMEFDEKPNAAIAGFRLTTGPDGPHHRYISEDAFAGESTLISLGRLTGVPTPVMSGLVAIASALNNIDYYSQGNNLKNLGLEDVSVSQLNHYLATGQK